MSLFEKKEEIKAAVTPAMPVPAFADLGKAANDVCGRDLASINCTEWEVAR